MRLAVLSDIHGNLEALSAVLSALSSDHIDRIACLGDAIGYGADPLACLERLHEVSAVMVAGNHEYGAIGKLSLDWFHRTARTAIEWTRDQLGFVELDMVRRLPLTDEVEPYFTLVHAGLRHPERFDYLIDMVRAADTLNACRTLFCLAGHTHLPCVVAYDREAHRVGEALTAPEALASVPFINDPERTRYLVNPGSVGQPRDGDPRASFAVIDTETRRIAIRRIPYDIATATRKIREAGLPEVLADRLELGR